MLFTSTLDKYVHSKYFSQFILSTVIFCICLFCTLVKYSLANLSKSAPSWNVLIRTTNETYVSLTYARNKSTDNGSGQGTRYKK